MQRVGMIALGLGVFVAVVGATPPFASVADAPSDAWLTTTAKIAILTSIGTRGSTVQVDTMNGTMTLYGKVTSPADKQNVEKLARSMEGVREVRNFLMIAPVAEQNAAATSDSELQSAVGVALIAAGLKQNSPLSGSNVSVQSVDKGTVLLAGTANSLTAHLRAIETAKNVQGVRAVRSDIQSLDAKAVDHARFLGQ
jgi:hyperosmotically inducible periplasmic protein